MVRLGMWVALAIFLATGAYARGDETEHTQSPVALNYCVDPDWKPYEAIRNGFHVGISYDYLQLIAPNAHFTLTLIPTTSWQQSLDLIATGECHFTPMLNRSPSREQIMSFSDSYFTSSNVLVGRSNSTHFHGYEGINNELVGVVRGYRQAEYLRRYYPSINLREFDNEEQNLRALSEGEVDLAVGSLLAVNSMIEKNGTNNIQVIGLAQPHDQLRVGVSKLLNSGLAPISIRPEVLIERFNRAISQISEQQHVNIYRQWNNVKYIESTDYRMIMWPSVILLLITIMVLWRNRSIARYNRMLAKSNQELEQLQQQLLDKNRTLEFLSVHDHLTKLHNRNYLSQRAAEAVQSFERFNHPVSLIIMDIDHFKQFNDRYGHSIGDDVLVAVANVAKACLREVDYIGRWGGEEFVLLCPNSDEPSAHVLAERIRLAVQQVELSGVSEPVTCSFGIAELNKEMDFAEWFDAADQCMLSAKSSGRNRIVCHANR